MFAQNLSLCSFSFIEYVPAASMRQIKYSSHRKQVSTVTNKKTRFTYPCFQNIN